MIGQLSTNISKVFINLSTESDDLASIQVANIFHVVTNIIY